MPQMKEQNKNSEELYKMETSNQPDEEVKIVVTRILNDLNDNFNKEIGNMKMKIENIKKNQSEIENTIAEMKNKLEGTNNRLDAAEY